MADNQQKRGRGWHGDPKGHAKAGRKGGQATAKSHDEQFYSDIGRKGGKNSSGNFKNNSQKDREAGRKGGSRSRSNRTDQVNDEDMDMF